MKALLTFIFLSLAFNTYAFAKPRYPMGNEGLPGAWCDRNCNKTCKNPRIPGGLDPVCKVGCEIEMEGCRLTTSVCARPFDLLFNIPTRVFDEPAFQSNSAVASLDEAADFLTFAGAIHRWEYEGVSVHYCNMDFFGASAGGKAHDRGRICLSHRLKGADVRVVGSTLAHELFHQRQYRSMGSDAFKCAYMREWVSPKSGGGPRTTTHENRLERDAYKFEYRVFELLEQKYNDWRKGKFFICHSPAKTQHWGIVGSFYSAGGAVKELKRLQELDAGLEVEIWRPRFKDGPWALVVAACATESDASFAVELAKRAGFPNESYVWRPDKTWSLERRVELAELQISP